MSNPEFTNLNNNEETNATEECGTKDEDCFNRDLTMKACDNSMKESTNLTGTELEMDNQEVSLEIITKNTTSASENELNILSDNNPCSNGSNESVLSDIQMEDTDQLPCQHKFEKNGTESYPSNVYLPSASSQTDMKFNKVQQGKPQSMNCNFSIVPNPNEFNLLKKKNSSMSSPDFLNQSTKELLAFSDNSIVISNSNAIPQSDSIVSSNYSLSQLQQYISDDDDDSVIEEVPAASKQYRDDNPMEDSDEDSDSSTSSSTSIIISETSSDSESEDEYENFNTKPISKPIKAKGELDLDDLPPIEDLTITVPEEECIPIGKVYQVVDKQVIVQAIKDSPAYDLDTVLFTEGGKPLGKVFDVMGPVTEPYYCVRFNSKEHIKEKNITLDQTIYAAPKTQYSKFVFLAQLMQLKGSDASWENDVEPPEIYLDYSDDEQEQKAKKKIYRNKKAVSKTDSDPDEPARKRHSAYVKRMNARNLKLSAVRGNQNPNKNRNETGSNILWQSNLSPMIGAFPPPPRAAAPCHQMFGRPPLFDLRVPLPNSLFPAQDGPYPEFSFPQPFAGTSRVQGPPPFAQHGNSPGPSPFSQNRMSPGPMPFSRPPCASPGPPSFHRNSSPGPPSFHGNCASPGPMPFPRPGGPSGNSPFPQPGGPPRHSPFPRSGASSGPGSFSRPFPTPGSGSPRGPVVVPPPYFPDPWGSPFFPAPQRNAPPPFPGPHPIRNGSPQGAQGAFPPQWQGQVNNQGNPPHYHFNSFVPPPSPNPSQ